jgi:hypothetical protein
VTGAAFLYGSTSGPPFLVFFGLTFIRYETDRDVKAEALWCSLMARML